MTSQSEHIEPACDTLYQQILSDMRLRAIGIDHSLSAPTTPWGAYIRIHDSSLRDFVVTYWNEAPELIQRAQTAGHNLSPKILLIAPNRRLSLQFHHRRREHWCVLEGPVKIILGATPLTLVEETYDAGSQLEIPCGYIHRITGLQTWAVIAELWEHTSPDQPSDENDIVRIEDDFSRKTI